MRQFFLRQTAMYMRYICSACYTQQCALAFSNASRRCNWEPTKAVDWCTRNNYIGGALTRITYSRYPTQLSGNRANFVSPLLPHGKISIYTLQKKKKKEKTETETSTRPSARCSNELQFAKSLSRVRNRTPREFNVAIKRWSRAGGYMRAYRELRIFRTSPKDSAFYPPLPIESVEKVRTRN